MSEGEDRGEIGKAMDRLIAGRLPLFGVEEQPKNGPVRAGGNGGGE